MSNLVFYIHTQNSSHALEIKNNSESAYNIYIEFISIFWKIKNKHIEIEMIQKMNNKIREEYDYFILKYKKKNPRLNKLKNTLDKIGDEEYFYSSPKSTYTNEELIIIANMIKVHNLSDNDKERSELFELKTNQEKEVFGDFFKKYSVSVFDSEKKIFIGESDREKRICRFCENSMNSKKKVTFKLKAHAFSEALGNKLIVLNEECDICNSDFGDTIEPDFINYLDIYRVFFKVKGKNGVPKLKYNNGAVVEHVKSSDIPDNDFLNKKNDLMLIKSRNIKEDKNNGVITAFLDSPHKIKNINVYKTLCKYVISTIDEKELVNLKKTISWISDTDSQYIKLPSIAIMISRNMYVETPVLAIYIRKNNNINIPHIVAEFKFKILVYVFIVPFSKNDSLDFTEKKQFNKYWDTFEHYSRNKLWLFKDFSSVKNKNANIKIKMHNKNP